MTNEDTDFDTWFDELQMHVLDRTGFQFNLRDVALKAFSDGKNVYDEIDEICEEYTD